MAEDPELVRLAHVDAELARGHCPFTGDRLERRRAGMSAWGDGWYCELCDCFGWDPLDPRIPEGPRRER